jgi:Family of unknown function (DUF6152)
MLVGKVHSKARPAGGVPMKHKALGFASVVIILIAVPAFAHHSFAMFDGSKTMTVQGTVKEFHWTNPHSWIFLMVENAEGQATEWPIELGSPGGLVRQGWVPKTLTPGMKVKVVIRPLKDGKPGGQFLAVTLPDGTQLGDPSTSGGRRGADRVD